MELIIDFSSDLQNEKYDMFIDTLYENNHLENYIKKVLALEKLESDRPLYLSLLSTNHENIQVINRALWYFGWYYIFIRMSWGTIKWV